jgi:hypothetical protein
MAEDPKKLAEAQKIANDAIKEGNDLTRTFGALLKANIKDAKHITVEIKSASNIIQRQLKDKKDDLKISDKIASLKSKTINVEKDISKISKQIADYNDIGHTAISEKLNTQKKGLEAEKEGLSLELKREEILESIVEKVKKIAEAISVAGIFAGLIAAAKKFGDSIDKIGESFGSLDVMGGKFQADLLRSSVEATKLGGGIGDVAAITSTLASNFGMNVDEAAKLSSKVFDTSKAIGLSSEEAANLFGSLTQTANLSAEQAESLAEGAFQLARQNGVAPSAVMKDIAGSSEEIASFTKDGGNNIAEAAVQARKMGLSLSTTAKISEGLLDFESSITKEVEASVLIGKQLNFQKAREFALSGDIAKATQEVVKQVGSEAEFNKLNVIQRKALADSIGVSVSEMAKLVGQSDKLSLSGAMAGKNFEDLLGEEGISNISELTGQFQALGASLVNTLGPALMMVLKPLNAIFEVFGKVIEYFEKSTVVTPLLGGALTALAAAYGLVKIQAAATAAGGAASIAVTVASAVANLWKASSLQAVSSLGWGSLAAIAIAGVGTAALFASMQKAKSVNDYKSGPGGITHMAGPAGTFSLNPRDSVLATTNPIPVNDFSSSPAGTKSIGPQSVDVNVIGEFKAGTVKFANERGLGSVNQVSTRPV